MRSADTHYLAVESRDIRRELYVTGHGRFVSPAGARYPAAGHPPDYTFDWKQGRTLADFVLVYLEQGEGEFESRSTGRIAWRTGEVLLLPPGVWHRYRPKRETGWTERWLCLNGDYLFRLRAKGLFPTQPLIRRLASPKPFLSAWGRLRDARENSLNVAARALQVVALAVEGEERSHRGASYAATADPVVNASLEFIWSNCHRPIDVTQVARFCGLGRRTLERRFARAQSRSPSREIEWARLERARQLLAETVMSVKEVGFAAGFSGPARFIRVFRTRFDATPGAFRALFRSSSRQSNP